MELHAIARDSQVYRPVTFAVLVVQRTSKVVDIKADGRGYVVHPQDRNHRNDMQVVRSVWRLAGHGCEHTGPYCHSCRMPNWSQGCRRAENRYGARSEALRCSRGQPRSFGAWCGPGPCRWFCGCMDWLSGLVMWRDRCAGCCKALRRATAPPPANAAHDSFAGLCARIR